MDFFQEITEEEAQRIKAALEQMSLPMVQEEAHRGMQRESGNNNNNNNDNVNNPNNNNRIELENRRLPPIENHSQEPLER